MLGQRRNPRWQEVKPAAEEAEAKDTAPTAPAPTAVSPIPQTPAPQPTKVSVAQVEPPPPQVAPPAEKNDLPPQKEEVRSRVEQPRKPLPDVSAPSSVENHHSSTEPSVTVPTEAKAQPVLNQRQMVRPGGSSLGHRVYNPPADLPVCTLPPKEEPQKSAHQPAKASVAHVEPPPPQVAPTAEKNDIPPQKEEVRSMLGQRRNPLLEVSAPSPVENHHSSTEPSVTVPTEAPAQPVLSEEQMGRAGETGLGRRVYNPPADLPVCSLPPEEESQMSASPGVSQSNEPMDIENSPNCDLGVLERFRRALTGVLLIVVGVLGCYLTGQVASFCESLRALSTLEFSILGTLMAVFVGVLAFALFNLVRLLFQLRTFTQLSGRSLQELDDRLELQRQTVKRNQEARERLTQLLNDAPERQYLTWRRLVKEQGKAEDLRSRRQRLLESHCSSEEWVKRYLEEWQSEVDKLVKERISYYSWRAASLATLSPFPLVDQLIVLATCMVLLKEMMQLYNLKAGWDRNLLLMGRAVVHVYTAGIWQPLMEQGVDQGTEILTDLLCEEGTQGIFESTLGESLAKHGLRLVGEGVMHKLSVGRFGHAAMRALRPVNPDK